MITSPDGAVPLGIQPFLKFVTVLRAHQFHVAPDQTQTFIEAVGLLGPRSMRDIHRAARATLAPPVERFDVFDALFRQVFLGQSVAADAATDTDDELQVVDERDGSMDAVDTDDIHEAGEQASEAENLSLRRFAAVDESTVMQQFRRHAAAQLPRRRTLRYRQQRNGRRWDLSRSLKDALRRDGEVLEIPRRSRTTRQRRVVLLIDISGSMKAQTELYLRFAHALGQVTERLEVFTLGTRLTRVSRALKHPRLEQALANAAVMVADWDGGTRLGDALQAFLGVPRFAGFTRGALVLVLSDALERGDPAAMTDAVRRLSALAWHLGWLTPLAASEDFNPETQALLAVMPYLDGLTRGATAADLCGYVTHAQRLHAGRKYQAGRNYQAGRDYRRETVA
jgi:uncharacterized protein with von Willebrand factor type A (vWA) domain